MNELLKFDQGTRSIFVDPGDVTAVLPHRDQTWSVLVLKSGKEHAVVGYSEDIARTINHERRRNTP